MARAPLIVHVVHGLRAGGLENGVVNLINRTPVERYRHAVVCLTGHDSFAERIQRDDVGLHDLGKREGKDLRAYLRLWRLLRRLRPAVVHTRNLGTLDMLVPAWLAGVPVRVHGEHGRDIGDLHGTNARHLRLRRLLRPLAQRYVALSGDFADYLTGTVGIPAERVEHICNGVDLWRFRPDATERERRRAERGWGRQTRVIGWVGRMEPVKNPVALARAFVELVDREPADEPETVLAMVGTGSQYEAVRGVLASAGLADRVWLPGPIDEVAGVLKAMDVFVLPSLAEGISNTILEAMACGLPVVATRVGGNPELVVDGETGELVSPGEASALTEAIERYIASPQRLTRHGEAARARAEERFDIEAMVTAYLDLYDRLLGTPGGARGVDGMRSEAG